MLEGASVEELELIPTEITKDLLVKLKYLPASPVYSHGTLKEDREIMYLRIFAHNPDPPVFNERISKYLRFAKMTRIGKFWRKYRAPIVYGCIIAMAAIFAIGILFISVEDCKKISGIRIGNFTATDNKSLERYIKCTDKNSTVERNCAIGAIIFSFLCSCCAQIFYSYDDKKFELSRNHVQDAINSLVMLYINVSKALLMEYIARLEEIRYDGHEDLEINLLTPKILDKMCKKIEGVPRISFQEMHRALDRYDIIFNKMAGVIKNHRAAEVLRPFKELEHLLRPDGGRYDLLRLILRADLSKNPALSRNLLIKKITTEDLKTIMRTIEILH